MSDSSSSGTNPRNTVNKTKPSNSTMASQIQKLTQDMEETRQSLKAIKRATASMTKTVTTSSQEVRCERLSQSDARTLEGKEQDSTQENNNQDESYVETQVHDDGIYKEIEALQQHLAKIEAGRQRYAELAYTASVEKAFIDKIIREPMPSNFKTPQLAEYDGTQHLVEHVQGYRMAMMVYGASNALLCKQFPATFRKAVQA
ncbi:hypothetical protein SLEP1_g45939 [Rubroshorea leprosula]|uniref:Uncharacterized protein n=1 Tax=Rubroshorea leprosula TaxID=152421 RepID=A0AAV5LKM4_9ROSI|nr:hypothetical protein SLEP1_g45939 [Rubroshorea leprosula]